MKEVIKARIDELQNQVNDIKQELLDTKEKYSGNATPESIQRISELKDKLLVYKGGLAELINLMNEV